MIREKATISVISKDFLSVLGILIGACFLGLQIAVQEHGLIAILLMGSTALLVIVKHPVFGVYLIAAITPLSQLQQFEFPLFSSAIRIIGSVTLLSFLAHYLVTAEYRLKRTELFLPIGIFVFAYVVGLFKAYELNQALRQVTVLVMYFILYILVVNLVRDRKTVKRMFIVLMIVASGLAVFGILQYFCGETFFAPKMGKVETFGLGSQSIIRAIGPFKNPNAFAYNYVLVIPLIMGLLLIEKKRLFQWIITGLLAICTLCLFLTFSRSAFLSLWVSLFIILFFMKRTQKVMISMGLLSVPIVLYAFSPELFDILQFRMFSASNYMGIHQRIELVKGGISTFCDNPFIGSGTGNAPIMLGKYTYHFRHGAHNNLIAVLVETGLLGFIPFSLIFINFTKKMVTAMSQTNDRDSRIILVAIFASIWGYFVNGLFHTSIAYALWWMILGLGVAYSNIVGHNDYRRMPPT